MALHDELAETGIFTFHEDAVMILQRAYRRHDTTLRRIGKWSIRQELLTLAACEFAVLANLQGALAGQGGLQYPAPLEVNYPHGVLAALKSGCLDPSCMVFTGSADDHRLFIFSSDGMRWRQRATREMGQVTGAEAWSLYSTDSALSLQLLEGRQLMREAGGPGEEVLRSAFLYQQFLLMVRAETLTQRTITIESLNEIKQKIANATAVRSRAGVRRRVR